VSFFQSSDDMTHDIKVKGVYESYTTKTIQVDT